MQYTIPVPIYISPTQELILDIPYDIKQIIYNTFQKNKNFRLETIQAFYKLTEDVFILYILDYIRMNFNIYDVYNKKQKHIEIINAPEMLKIISPQRFLTYDTQYYQLQRRIDYYNYQFKSIDIPRFLSDNIEPILDNPMIPKPISSNDDINPFIDHNKISFAKHLIIFTKALKDLYEYPVSTQIILDSDLTNAYIKKDTDAHVIFEYIQKLVKTEIEKYPLGVTNQ